MNNSIEIRNPVIKVIGIGGYGVHSINYMIKQDVKGIEFIAIDTDAETLSLSLAHTKLQIGHASTKESAKDEICLAGHDLTEENRASMESLIGCADMVFIAASMSGKAGAGLAPILAHIAKGMNILTVAVIDVTIFGDEERQRCTEEGIKALQEGVDALIVLPIIRLIENQGNGVSALKTISSSSDLMCITIADIAGSINVSGMINIDVAGLHVIMANSGNARMETATASGVDRARIAVEQAIGKMDMAEARGILLLITSTSSVKLKEVAEAMHCIQSVAHNATLILSSAYDDNMGDLLRVTVIATSNRNCAGLDLSQA